MTRAELVAAALERFFTANSRRVALQLSFTEAELPVVDEFIESAHTLAALLRESQPAPGAEAMREAAAKVAEHFIPLLIPVIVEGVKGMRPPSSGDVSEQIAAAIRALPLPAREVPE